MSKEMRKITGISGINERVNVTRKYTSKSGLAFSNKSPYTYSQPQRKVYLEKMAFDFRFVSDCDTLASFLRAGAAVTQAAGS